MIMSGVRVFLSLIFLVSIMTVAVTQPPEKMPRAEEITKSWATLSDKYSSLKMTWKQKVHHTGYVGESILVAMKITRDMEKNAGRNPPPIVIPGKEYRNENEYSFILSNQSWRLEKSGLQVYVKKENPIPDNWALVFDGTVSTLLKSPSSLPHHQAILTLKKHKSEFDVAMCRPIANQLLGANSEIAGPISLDNYQITVHQPVAGMKAIQAKKTDPNTKKQISYVFIPSLDYAIAEHSIGQRKDKTHVHYKAEFDPKSRIPFIPKTWTYKVQMDGKLSFVYSHSLESLSVNVPVADDAFRLTFPPGTLVFDQRIDQKPVRYTVPDAKPPEKK
jgi:hypothetical protein